MLVREVLNYQDSPLSEKTVRIKYTLAQKLETVDKALAVNCSLTVASLILGVGKSTLKSWIRGREKLKNEWMNCARKKGRMSIASKGANRPLLDPLLSSNCWITTRHEEQNFRLLRLGFWWPFGSVLMWKRRRLSRRQHVACGLPASWIETGCLGTRRLTRPK